MKIVRRGLLIAAVIVLSMLAMESLLVFVMILDLGVVRAMWTTAVEFLISIFLLVLLIRKRNLKKIFGIASILFIMTLNSCFGVHTGSTSSSVPSFGEGENSIIFIGHGTALIHLNGTNILTDPNFNNRLIVFRRSREAGVRIENLPPIDAILISHAHRDHLDGWTLRQFSKDIPVLISKGHADCLRQLGFKNIHELDVWEGLHIKDVKITAMPAKHSGARNSPFAEVPRALSYMIQGEKTVYFAGDTGLFDRFKEIGSHYQIDVALLPVGGYRPRWFMKGHHMSPDDAIEAMEMLEVKEMIPIHWGSFRMALDGVDEPKDVLLRSYENSHLKGRIHILENGAKFLL